MARSQNTFNKKEREKKKQQKKKAKAEKRAEKKDKGTSGNLDDMMAYLDEYGNIVDTPPEVVEKEEIDAESIEIGIPKQTQEEESAEKTGVVAFFNEGKGYGFINENNTKEQFFVHFSNLEEPVVDGDAVQFEIEKNERGFAAVKVKKVK
ncbi:MAG: cold shock domain-containing protein [Cytophagales bacterium]|nr:cold shock domain-containing protein [Cytophagales bacterium]